MHLIDNLSENPVVLHLNKTNRINCIANIDCYQDMQVYYIYWNLPEKEETIFWLKFSNRQQGIERVDEIQTSNTV